MRDLNCFYRLGSDLTIPGLWLFLFQVPSARHETFEVTIYLLAGASQ